MKTQYLYMQNVIKWYRNVIQHVPAYQRGGLGQVAHAGGQVGRAGSRVDHAGGRELQDGRELQEEQKLVTENMKDNPKRYNELLDMSSVCDYQYVC